MDKEYIKITKNGEVMRRLNLLDILDKADIILENKNVKRIYGKYAVLFLDKDCGCITYLLNNIEQLTYIVEDIKEEDFDKVIIDLEKFLNEKGYKSIISDTGIFEKI